MEHVDALELMRVTDQELVQIRELIKQESQPQVVKVMIIAGWPGR